MKRMAAGRPAATVSVVIGKPEAPSFHAVVGCFLGDPHVVDVALPDACGGDLDEFGARLHVGDAGAAAEEKDAFDVVLEAAGDKKIQVIKEVRALTNLGLGEAKALVDGAPGVVLEGANKETAEKAKAALEEAGGTVTLK